MPAAPGGVPALFTIVVDAMASQSVMTFCALAVVQVSSYGGAP